MFNSISILSDKATKNMKQSRNLNCVTQISTPNSVIKYFSI